MARAKLLQRTSKGARNFRFHCYPVSSTCVVGFVFELQPLLDLFYITRDVMSSEKESSKLQRAV